MSLLFSSYLAKKSAQIMAGPLTDSFFRINLMSITTTASNLCVFIWLYRAKISLKYVQIMTLLLFFFLVLRNIVHLEGAHTIVIILCVLVRFTSEIVYSCTLIWSIEALPTVCRSTSLCLQLSACSLATILAYFVIDAPYVLEVFNMIFICVSVYMEHTVGIEQRANMCDCLNGQNYDSHDYFYLSGEHQHYKY